MSVVPVHCVPVECMTQGRCMGSSWQRQCDILGNDLLGNHCAYQLCWCLTHITCLSIFVESPHPNIEMANPYDCDLFHNGNLIATGKNGNILSLMLWFVSQISQFWIQLNICGMCWKNNSKENGTRLTTLQVLKDLVLTSWCQITQADS